MVLSFVPFYTFVSQETLIFITFCLFVFVLCGCVSGVKESGGEVPAHLWAQERSDREVCGNGGNEHRKKTSRVSALVWFFSWYSCLVSDYNF